MSRPRFGEIWLAPEGTVMPGGMLCLIVSANDVNTRRDRVIVVEVVDHTLATADALTTDLGPIGVALTGSPFTVSYRWFNGSDEPVHTLQPDRAAVVADQIRALLGH